MLTMPLVGGADLNINGAASDVTPNLRFNHAYPASQTGLSADAVRYSSRSEQSPDADAYVLLRHHCSL
eukprot:950900-Pleurochrysis_carterae.AAC.16